MYCPTIPFTLAVQAARVAGRERDSRAPLPSTAVADGDSLFRANSPGAAETRDRPWLWIGRNALWIAVPLIASLVFGRWTTSELVADLLWLPTIVGVGVIMFKFLRWNAFRPRGQSVSDWEGLVGVVLLSFGQIVLAVGVVYVVLHFVVKYW